MRPFLAGGCGRHLLAGAQGTCPDFTSVESEVGWNHTVRKAPGREAVSFALEVQEFYDFEWEFLSTSRSSRLGTR